MCITSGSMPILRSGWAWALMLASNWQTVMDDDVLDSVPVQFEVLGVERVQFGRIVALANVEIGVADVTFVLQGVRIVKGRSGGMSVEGPTWHHPRQHRDVPAVLLPDELRDAIGAEVIERLLGEAKG